MSFILFGRVVPIFPMWTMDPISALQRESSQKIEQAVLAWIKFGASTSVKLRALFELEIRRSEKNAWRETTEVSNRTEVIDSYPVLFSSFQSSSIQLYPVVSLSFRCPGALQKFGSLLWSEFATTAPGWLAGSTGHGKTAPSIYKSNVDFVQTCANMYNLQTVLCKMC